MKRNTRGYDLGQLLRTTAIFLTVFLQSVIALEAQQVNRIDPPNWWTGMEHDTLELLVYGEDLENVKDVEVKGDAVEVLSWSLAESAKHIYLTVRVAAESGSHEIRFDFGRGKKARFAWQIRERPGHQPQEHRPSDMMYLITPDRFSNGDPENDAVAGMNETTVDREAPFGRHGGDIQGIIDRLDYIRSLGVSSVWSSPLLENDMHKESYHGYAITDFYNVDRRFGDNALYCELSRQLRKRGMKLVMDAVYNHCGDQHPLFLDPPSKDWFNRWENYTQTNYRAATFIDPYASEADKKRFHDGWFVPTMPDFNQRNPHVAKYLMQNTIWLITYVGIDAIRIDTYAYPDQDFMNRLIQEVQREYDDFYFFGEIWVTGHQVQGGWTRNPLLGEKSSALPNVLDFQFCYGLQEMCKQGEGWANGVGRFYLTLAGDWMYDNPDMMVTFADNHDMGRIFGEVGQDLEKMKVAMGVLLTSRGIPCLYYGTEILMKETANHGVIRQDFPGGWDGDETSKFVGANRNPQEQTIHEMISTLGQLRRDNPTLFEGEFVHFVPQDGVYVYFRDGGDKRLMCIVNADDEPQELELRRFAEMMPEDSVFRGVLSDTVLQQRDTLTVQPMSFSALLSE